AYGYYFKADVKVTTIKKTRLVASSETLPNITFNKINYGWSGESLFSNLSLDIEPGSIYGFVGKSGSGKSTLMQLALGVLSPQQGDVKIDGVAPEEWLQAYSSRVGYVGVLPFLVNGTIRENITYGVANEVSDEEIWEALKEVDLEEAIKDSDKGLDTLLNEYGDGLSSGQKQRLSIARALLKKPLLLVLDEPTANLDEKTEREVFKMVENFRKKMTIILVCHKASYSYLYDKFLDLDSLDVITPSNEVNKEV
ncbi:MAG: ABC transporter ATP-binding protein/permease, partial [Bdellovibrionales bacterium]|nr:ABC transporter ATP-binding protein/permease [Bdellovibrionales bacterium]